MFFTISAVFNRYKFCIKQLHPRYGNVTKLLQTPDNLSLPQICYKNIDYFHKTKYSGKKTANYP